MAVFYPGQISVYSTFSKLPAQAAVGSAASGRGSGGTIPVRVPPTAVVAGSKVAPHSEHTWLKQQFGVQL